MATPLGSITARGLLATGGDQVGTELISATLRLSAGSVSGETLPRCGCPPVSLVCHRDGPHKSSATIEVVDERGPGAGGWQVWHRSAGLRADARHRPTVLRPGLGG